MRELNVTISAFVLSLTLAIGYSIAQPVPPPGVRQVGSVTPNNCVKWSSNLAVADAGVTCGGTGSPGGSNTEVQFNDSGAFGGDAGFTYNKATKVATVDEINAGIGTVGELTISLPGGSFSDAGLSMAGAADADAQTALLTPMVGDTGAGGEKGLVPAPAMGDAGKYLSGAGTWDVVSTGIAIDTTVISGGTSGRVLYDNAGTVGEKVVTGTGDAVLATSPTLVTPTIGAALATSINGLTLTSSSGTLTIANGKILSVSNSIAFAGTDSTTMTFPSTSATIARTDTGQTFTGTNAFGVTNYSGDLTATGNSGTNVGYISANDVGVSSRFDTGRSGFAAFSGRTLITNSANNPVYINTSGGVTASLLGLSTLIGGVAADTFISRTSAGIVRIGTAAANASGTLQATAGTFSGAVTAAGAVAPPSGGSTSARLLLGSTSGFGIYFGEDSPSVSAAQGSIYLRTDGSGINNRMYINTNGGTSWTNVVTGG